MAERLVRVAISVLGVAGVLLLLDAHEGRGIFCIALCFLLRIALLRARAMAGLALDPEQA